ncbi:YifB family Mg chelatase-like AAA ATPase [Alicyclobacillus sp.]|uniref:YifB family Mg chelatase-like AAA ATPase n=1 Tax=Alicyclobacillus sp. TaxID=61169 RepID=UPI0025BF930A|nr:YifB family Mg chelatase-like AAA ATPase [Alicyclobacillus sp.]MCL6515653.1 YifB family Mg chelatase-like AAA ATPase [Alicyclobacillus sp.]
MVGTAVGAVLEGIRGALVTVEADVGRGLPQFHIVGLPDSAVNESKLRIRSAIRQCGLEFPNQRITVNLSPASVRKRGAGLDLAIAVAILRAAGVLPGSETPLGFAAELSLSGALVAVPEAVNLAIALAAEGIEHLVVARAQAVTCVPVPNLTWHLYSHLADLIRDLRAGGGPRRPYPPPPIPAGDSEVSLDDVLGQEAVKRALVIAAAGHHHILLVGPPGCGKTMLAERLHTLLPDLSPADALEVHAIHLAGGSRQPTLRPPLRMPHHSVGQAGLIGGGSPPAPGEVTLAHRGVLVLDEMLEFRRAALEALREPLVHGAVHLTRAGRSVTYPAAFLLVGTLNPCPCGQSGFGTCTCPQAAVQRYWSHLSGPLLDRIDMVIPVLPEHGRAVLPAGPRASVLRQAVVTARDALAHRPADAATRTRPADFTLAAHRRLQLAAERLPLSQRGRQAIARLARTLSALDGADAVDARHIDEAIAHRTTGLPQGR